MADDNQVSRRMFLKTGLVGGVLLAAGAGALVVAPEGKVSTDIPGDLAAVEPSNWRALVAMIEAVIPDGDYDIPSLALAFDQRLSHGYPGIRKDMNLGLALLENPVAGGLTRGGFKRFSTMNVAERQQALYRWRDSRIGLLGLAYIGMRKLVLGSLYGDLDVAKEVGYPGPPWLKDDPGPIEARKPLSPPFVVQANVDDSLVTDGDPALVTDGVTE